MPYSNSDAGNLYEATVIGQKKNRHIAWQALSYSSQWNCFHRWPLAVIWLLSQRDGKIHVVPFEICSCVMPTRAEYCQSTKAVTLVFSLTRLQIHKRRYTLLCCWPWPHILLWHHLGLLCLKMNAKPREASPNAKLSCFIPYPTPHALYDWIHLVKCHTAPTTIVARAYYIYKPPSWCYMETLYSQWAS